MSPADPVGAPQRAALIGIVLLAAALRFTGLSWGLRHPVHSDERVYVENVVKMVEAGDFDHRFYTYPGLFYYVLAPGVWLLGPERWNGPDAYLVSRALVSAFGIFNVALVCFAGARLIAPSAGLVAALLMAVSPVDVQTCHEVRPDVILETLGLLALLGLRQVGAGPRGDALMGILIGLASSVKFTGLLLIPSYVATRLAQAGPRTRGLLLSGAVTIGVALACTPSALIHAREYSHGPPRQLQQYYPGTGGPRFRANLAFFLEVEATALGGLGAALVPLGAFLCLRRRPRYWGPALLHPIVTLVVMSTGALVFQRYVLPAMGLVDLLAAAPIALLARRHRSLAVLLTLAAAAVPLRASAAYARFVSAPSAQDNALDWIERHVAPGARVLETRPDADPGGRAGSMIGLDARHELVHLRASDDRAGLRLLAREMDLVITGPGAGGLWGEALRTLYQARGPAGGVVLQLKAPEERFRPRYEPIVLEGARRTASENAEALGALADGDPGTAWSTAGRMRGNEWIQLEFETGLDVGRVELFMRDRPSLHDPELQLWTTEDGRTYSPARMVAARPGLLKQAAAGSRLSQLLVLEGKPIRGLRILQLGARTEPWAISELRVDALAKR